MGRETGISWTDATFNPWIGCTKVSPGCDHCYAETQDHRWGHDSWGKGKPRRLTSDANWRKPLQWNHEAAKMGTNLKVFCGSLCDIMDDEAPNGAREQLWQLIDATPHLTWLLLTKRPHRYESYLPAQGFRHLNVILGTTTENQHFYDIRFNILENAAISWGLRTFISYEPALGPLSIAPKVAIPLWRPDWVIVGGESGPGRRAFEEQWAVELREECKRFDVKFFMKQMSASTPAIGKALIPAHLLVQEFPE